MTWMTAVDIARIYETTPAYVRKLAHRYRWRRVKVGRFAAYHLADVREWDSVRRVA